MKPSITQKSLAGVAARMVLVLAASSTLLPAQTVVYQDEASFTAAVAARGCTTIREGFEDDSIWGQTRAPLSRLSVASQGILWTSNHVAAVSRPAGLATSQGAAVSGAWGLYSSPHGSPDATSPDEFLRDGFAATIDPRLGRRLCGLGGWFTGFPGSQLRAILDGGESSRISLGPIDSAARFYGVVAASGFYKLEIRETEGTLEDQKFTFADDVLVSTSAAAADSLAVVSAASFWLGGALPPGSIAAAFGGGLAGVALQAPAGALPTNLGDTQVVITDHAAAARPAGLYWVSPSQVNFVVPENASPGPAKISVLRAGTVVATGSFNVETVAPALFSANGTGQGVAAAVLMVRNRITSATSYQLVFQCDAGAGTCAATPIDLGGPTDDAFLELFGAGIRGRSALDAVRVTIDSEKADVLYAGPQGTLDGMDQLNVQVPYNLARRGNVEVRFSADGTEGNPVQLNIR